MDLEREGAGGAGRRRVLLVDDDSLIRRVDWAALARAEPPAAPRLRPTVDLAAVRREFIHGAFLVHRRNVSSTARALGLNRSSLQRVLRRAPPPAQEEDE
jgi:DNA-binding NtrC family response regulator